MAIYDFFEAKIKENSSDEEKRAFDTLEKNKEFDNKRINHSKKDRLFTSLAVRIFFLLLLVADGLWMVYALALFALSMVGMLLTFFHGSFFKEIFRKAWTSVKRSLACGLSLFLALFSPAFGIMVACTYFLMYDKEGIEEVVPASLQPQFKEFLNLY